MLLIKRLGDMLSALKRPDVRELKEILSALDCTPELIAPYVSEPDRLPYGRNVLFRSDEVEAIVVHLPARSETYIHDHGCSAGCALVVEGVMLNTVYNADERGEAAYAAHFHVREGQTLLAPKGQIHQMSNPGARRTVSLHLYAPPLSGAKTYARADQYVLDYVI
jgi:cysteine dioxygenase